MTKNELKVGMVIIRADGAMRIVVPCKKSVEGFAFADLNGKYSRFEFFDDDLVNETYPDETVIGIYSTSSDTKYAGKIELDHRTFLASINLVDDDDDDEAYDLYDDCYDDDEPVFMTLEDIENALGYKVAVVG